MKNKPIVIALALICIIAACAIGVFLMQGQTRTKSVANAELYSLDEANYASNKNLIELTATEYDEKIAAGESFVVIARTLVCPASTPLATTVESFLAQNELTVYSLLSDEFEASSLTSTVRYLPSAAIVIEGEVVKFLDAESDDDLYAYQNAENFKDWLSKSIKLSAD